MWHDLILLCISLWLMILLCLVRDAGSKKPEHRANGEQATRNTNPTAK